MPVTARVPGKIGRRDDCARALGVSTMAVRKWEAAGLVVRTTSGLIDIEATAARVDAARDPIRGGKGGHEAQPGYSARAGGARKEPLPPADAKGKRPRAEPASDGATLLKARAAHETLKAQLAKLKLDLAEGRLVDRAEVERVWYEEVRRVRDRLLSLPSSLAGAALSSGGDLRVAEEAIRAEIESALLRLAQEPVGRGSGGGSPDGPHFAESASTGSDQWSEHGTE